MKHPTEKGDVFATLQNPTKRWVALAFYGPDGVEFTTSGEVIKHFYGDGLAGVCRAFLNKENVKVHVRAESDAFAAVRDCFLV